MIRRKKGPKKPPKPRKVYPYNGINFKSGLEVFAYKALTAAGLKFGYENKTYLLQEGFVFKNATYRKSGKKMVYEEKAKIQAITHRPDFNGDYDVWILETKGEIKADNILRIKMLKFYLNQNGLKTVYFMAHNQKDVLHCIELIKKLKHL